MGDTPSVPVPTGYFAGFDTFSFNFPVFKFDELMPSLIANFPSINWVGFYYERSGLGFTADAYRKLVGWGYGIAPIFFGKQLSQVPASPDPFSLGRTQGATAASNALAAGVAANSILYFDVEPGPRNEAWLLHYAGWCDAVVDSQYLPGAYLRWEIVDWLFAGLRKIQTAKSLSPAAATPQIWAVNYATVDSTRPPNVSTPPVKQTGQQPTTPSSSIGPAPSTAHPLADMFQWNPGQFFQWTDAKTGKKFELFPVDLNTSTTSNPGASGAIYP